ncbi:MAG TPA: phosphatase PAP2-related protein [Flavobacteriales bacterium]
MRGKEGGDGAEVPWTKALSSRRYAMALAITLGLGAVIALLLPQFFTHLALRPGTIPFEPLLPLLGPAQLSVPIFTVLYGMLAGALVVVLPRPYLLLRALQAYVLILLLRMISMWMFTLQPPADLVPLHDPLTAIFYPDGEAFTKDLFFSGHTATMALLVALAHGKWQQAVALAATGAVGVMVLAQHAHWTIDVVAAPVFVGLAWWISRATWTASVSDVR